MVKLKMHFKSRGGIFAVVFAIVVAMVLAASIAGCMAGARRNVPVAGPTDLARGSERYSDLTAGDLEAGRTVLVGRCSSCHQTPDPSSQTAQAWPAQVAQMKTRAHLDANQVRAVERYLVTMSLQPESERTSQSASGSSR
jgi:hypothetical protein